MPTRHLSDEQRQHYARFAATPSPNELSRYFHLDSGDREVVDELRGDHNRLGFGLMLGSARFLGGVAQGSSRAVDGMATEGPFPAPTAISLSRSRLS